MLSSDQITLFNDVLKELGKSLDITKEQYDAVVTSYSAVGAHLSKEDSSLHSYKPEILPQGSFMLGTMIKPINESDDLDIDLVCQLEGKKESWVQHDLKKEVGDQIKRHGTYAKMLEKPDGRRCWTLMYADKSNYHMDILPAIVDSGYRILLEKAFSDQELQEIKNLGIRITDKERNDYFSQADHREWLKSNPFGYARWFFDQASLDIIKAEVRMNAVKPVPDYQEEKLPLQRVVQILKRHRDIMFNGHKNKPISIIITTLASRAYNNEANIIEALQNIVIAMPSFVQIRYSEEHGRAIKWVENPVNLEENFADKWAEAPDKEKMFYRWMEEVQKDVQELLVQRGPEIGNFLTGKFGNDAVTRAMSNYGEKQRLAREKGNLRMDPKKSGALGATGILVKSHNFHGKD